MTTTNRLALAFDQLTFEHGFVFERFALAFLASEIDDLRPVGGMHDGGRDAFVHQSGGSALVFVQCSVTRNWKGKIRDTVTALQKNKHELRELIYCTPLDIQADADELRSEMRRVGLSLDIRDRGYFLSRAERSTGHKAASESLAKQLVDPLLASKKVLLDVSLTLTPEDEKVAFTYLQLELQERAPGKGLTKLCFDALVTFVLREASPDALSTRAAIQAGVRRHVRGGDAARTNAQVDGTLQRLVNRGSVKHHRKEDAFTLAHEHRESMRERVASLLSHQMELKNFARDLAVHVAKDLGVDYPFAEDAIAADAIRVLDRIVHDSGRLAAVALVGDEAFAAPQKSVDRLLVEMLRARRQDFESSATLSDDQIRDLVPLVVERLCASTNRAVSHRLRSLADAYCLQFLLQQTPDVQEAIQKIVSGVTLLVDTSICVRAMAEIVLPASGRRITNLLLAAKAMGCRLVATPDVLNELETHLARIRHNYRMRHVPTYRGEKASEFEKPLLERAWEDATRSGAYHHTFEEMLEQFIGTETPAEDIIDYLAEELHVEYAECKAEFDAIEPADLGTLFDEWKAKKFRRPWVDDQAFETLVLHDVRAFLLVEQQRRTARTSGSSGHRWWWLAIDWSALHFDRARSAGVAGGRVCMSPEFFARYLSLAPKPKRTDSEPDVPALALEAASLGLVPAKLREEAGRLYASLDGQREYLRRRRLRELVNRAMATAGDPESHESVDEPTAAEE